MEFRVETEQEVDGRWIAEVLDVPGALAYGGSKLEAVAKAEAIARIAKHTGLKPSDL